MKFFEKQDSEFIILKDGYNKALIMGVIIVIGVACFLVSTKYILPDGRENMTLNNDVEMTFRDTMFKIQEDYFYNKDIYVGQISLKESCINENEDELKIDIRTDYDFEVPFNLIKGNAIPEAEGATVTIRDYILQFNMPDDTYYMTFTFTKGGIDYSFTIDYRDFKEENIKELDLNYLADKNNLQTQINDLERQKTILEEQLKSTEKQEEKTDLSTRIKVLENDIEVCKKKIETLEKGV